MDWLDLLSVQGTLKSLLQHHSSKASILRRSAFFRVQLSHPYMTTGKTIALTRWTFVGQVMSLLFNMLSKLVIAFLSRSKSFNFMAAVTICKITICSDWFAAADATAKSLQSCLTLCDPRDSSPPGFPVPGILQARTLEWVAISSPMHENEKWKWSRSVVSDSSDPMNRSTPGLPVHHQHGK